MLKVSKQDEPFVSLLAIRNNSRSTIFSALLFDSNRIIHACYVHQRSQISDAGCTTSSPVFVVDGEIAFLVIVFPYNEIAKFDLALLIRGKIIH